MSTQDPTSVQATHLGHPRFGLKRELKKALEAYWKGSTSAEVLFQVAADLRRRHWTTAHEKGLDSIPSNDFSLYDHMLDMAVTVGAVPVRYRDIADPLTRYFAMARGLQDHGVDISALEMTKWFDTNYHYIVPELAPTQTFALDATKILAEIDEARSLGLETRPVIPGPVTFLLLSKIADAPELDSKEAGAEVRTLDLLDSLLPVYDALLETLAERKLAWVQLDEPCLATDLDVAAREAYRRTLTHLARHESRPRIMLTTYFGGLRDNLSLATGSTLDALHLDLVRAPEQLDQALASLPASMSLSLGVVDGRNIWRTDLDAAHATVRKAVAAIGTERVTLASSCSLLHVPIDLEVEKKLDPELKSWLAFATQKLGEIRALADAATETGRPRSQAFDATRKALASRRASPRTRNPEVRRRASEVTEAMLRRGAPFRARREKQHARFGLPPLPTTTIGSFPQTGDVRGSRAAWRAGRIDDTAYEQFLEEETRRCIERQESLGIDVLVHGEFERNDMVEYFGEQLDGFAFTQHGWVQSYGSRGVKPPVLFGDIARPAAMTVRWSRYAQSLSKRPVKGMLTGPVTILQWSFVRDDQPRSETCRQIALALREEVADLERAGIGMIQVDEPAIREGLPLRRADWSAYLGWAVDAFRLATSGVQDETQIHTHMCYSEFGDILASIAAMDADVLSIETSRSKMELLGDFARFAYPNEIGPGVYDIHSPRVPTQDEIVDLLEHAQRVVPVEQLWVNPDCGLKTRSWPEVEAALMAMVAAARTVRTKLERPST